MRIEDIDKAKSLMDRLRLLESLESSGHLTLCTVTCKTNPEDRAHWQKPTDLEIPVTRGQVLDIVRTEITVIRSSLRDMGVDVG